MPEPLVRGGGPGVSLTGLLNWQRFVAKSGLRLRQKIHTHPLLSRRIPSLKSSRSVTEQTKPPSTLGFGLCSASSWMISYTCIYLQQMVTYTGAKNIRMEVGIQFWCPPLLSLNNKRRGWAKCWVKSWAKTSCSTSCPGTSHPLSSWTQTLHLSYSQIFFSVRTHVATDVLALRERFRRGESCVSLVKGATL